MKGMPYPDLNFDDMSDITQENFFISTASSNNDSTSVKTPAQLTFSDSGKNLKKK